jgi:hypothetical protein
MTAHISLLLSLLTCIIIINNNNDNNTLQLLSFTSIIEVLVQQNQRQNESHATHQTK